MLAIDPLGTENKINWNGFFEFIKNTNNLVIENSEVYKKFYFASGKWEKAMMLILNIFYWKLKTKSAWCKNR